MPSVPFFLLGIDSWGRVFHLGSEPILSQFASGRVWSFTLKSAVFYEGHTGLVTHALPSSSPMLLKSHHTWSRVMKSRGLSLISWTRVGMYLTNTLNAVRHRISSVIVFGLHSFAQGPLSWTTMVHLALGVPNLSSSCSHLTRHWKAVTFSDSGTFVGLTRWIAAVSYSQDDSCGPRVGGTGAF